MVKKKFYFNLKDTKRRLLLKTNTKSQYLN